ncbi:MAG: hypothetical protein HY331_15270 [Chloroflexi bacterium]|nr:hypothetical protein [Chloroflexota bacterium]
MAWEEAWPRLAEVTARIDLAEMALAAETLDEAALSRLTADLRRARDELAELERALGIRPALPRRE